MNLVFATSKCFDIYRIHNVSVYNRTVYFIYFKIVYRQGLTIYYFEVYE